MPDLALNISKDLPGICLIPAPVQLLGRNAKLDDEIARQVLRLDLAALFPPEPEEGGFIIAHNDPGVGAADKIAPIGRVARRNAGDCGVAFEVTRCDRRLSNWATPVNAECGRISLGHGLPPWLGLGLAQVCGLAPTKTY